MFIAQYESANFLFEGAGETAFKAKVALKHALAAHCQRTGARLREFFYADEVFVREVREGWYFIDKERVA